ncbi:MAG: pirin family protein [Ginsengibacter sp.]
MAKSTLYKAKTRGHANHGWLNSFHTFSFADYRNADRMNFGTIRVLNDDTVAPGMGFGTHRHENMEIISIPLAGDLEHKDSMGNSTIIKNSDIQVLSAGTGISHSEYNHNKDKEVKFLQIWIIPNQQNVKPRYDQISLNIEDRKNKLQQILSPNQDDEGVWIHQDAWFHLGTFDKDFKTNYHLKKEGNGVFIFVLNGNFTVNSEKLSDRDGYGLWDVDQFDIQADSQDAELLIMEVPMKF